MEFQQGARYRGVAENATCPFIVVEPTSNFVARKFLNEPKRQKGVRYGPQRLETRPFHLGKTRLVVKSAAQK